MNRAYIETHGLGVDVKQVNVSGAKVAKAVAGPGQYVLGDISSNGQLLVESMYDLREALCALRACRDVTSLPVLVTLSFRSSEQGGPTAMGNTARESAVSLVDAGATAGGAHCGYLVPHETAPIIGMMRGRVEVPLVAQPNAGKPWLVDGQTAFDMSPDDTAAGVAECIASTA
jgi:5-methyltetrahydrofolate--homocysteine methyltransferase